LNAINGIAHHSIIIYIDTPFELRVKRFGHRQSLTKIDSEHLNKLDQHKVENETDLLKSKANILVTSTSNYLSEIKSLISAIS
jgi:dephospho-CoA kinase